MVWRWQKVALVAFVLAGAVGCSAVARTALVNNHVLETGALVQPVSPGSYINISIHLSGDEDKLLPVLWIDGNGITKWRGSLANPSPFGGVKEAVVPVMEPTTTDNVLHIGRHIVKFTVERPLSTTPLVSRLTTVEDEKKDVHASVSGKPGEGASADSTKLMDLLLLGHAPDTLDDSPLSREMADSLVPLRSVMREIPSSVSILVGDDALRQKIERALITEAGVWLARDSLSDVVIVSADKTRAGKGHKLTIQVEGEQDIPQLVNRMRELFPPPVTISDTQGNPVPAKVHSFHAGSGMVFFIDPLAPAPPVIVVHSREPASWSDVRRGVVLGTGMETALPGNLPSPHIVAMLPYTVMRLDARVEASLSGGMLFRIAIVADKPVTAPHIVTVRAVDQNGKLLPGSLRAIRLKRGAARRWYQWGEEEGHRAAAVIFRDVLTGCSTELSVRGTGAVQ
jgi:hypothetical protein